MLIFCHGSGGSGSAQLGAAQRYPELASSFILVAPDHKGTTDAKFVGATLLDHLATFSNVKPEFKIHGYSQGAALTNQILIEIDDPRIIMAVTAASQANAQQFHDGSFYTGDGAPKNTLTRRQLLQVTGAADTVIPAEGPPARGVAGYMVQWEESAFEYAKAMGVGNGVKQHKMTGADYDSVEYGEVTAINWQGQGHGVGGPNMKGFSTVVVPFLKTGQLPAPAPTVPPAPTMPCTEECENEFINGCMNFHCSKGARGNPKRAYDWCRADVDATRGPVSVKCEAKCEDTPAMSGAKAACPQ